MKLRTMPLELAEADAFVVQHHRHHGSVGGHRFSIGVVDEQDILHGCAIVGRPVSGTDPKRVIEVTRCCTDGTPNACSVLYSAAARAAQAIGYERIQTYIYKSEHGASLKASGWQYDRDAHPSGRHRERSDGTTRDTTHVGIEKTLWFRQLRKPSGTYRHHMQKGFAKPETVDLFSGIEVDAH
jgi:hypothetical protein